jgi:uncharacterized protein (TIGR02453 family)
MTTTCAFDGFPPTTLPFLRALRDHADRDWFAAHRSDYLDAYDRPAKALLTALDGRLDGLTVDPRVGGSIFRVTRDRRFTSGGTPYKGYLDLWAWEGDRPLAVGGCYLRITPDVVRWQVGARAFSREALARYRRAVLDPVAGPDLVALAEPLAEMGCPVEGATLSGLPRGLDPAATDVLDDARRQLLRHTALLVDVDQPAAGLVDDGPALVEATVRHWRRGLPLHRWLVAHVQT